MTQHYHLIFMTITVAHQCRKVDECEAEVLLQFSATFKYCGTERGRRGGGGGRETSKQTINLSNVVSWKTQQVIWAR